MIHPSSHPTITTGVILAAGMARRLRPLTDDMPKCLLPLGDRNLLERTVDAMRMAGVERLVVVTGYKAQMIRSFLETHYPQLDLIFLDNTDYANNNNIYSLWMAGKVVRGEEFLLMDSDIFCDPQAVLAVVCEEGSALALNRHPLGEEEMKIVTDEAGNITEISKTCNPADAMGESVGIERITADYSDAIVFGDALNDMSMFIDDWTTVAMGNAVPELKAKADIVTTEVDRDGIWNACDTLGLFEPVDE